VLPFGLVLKESRLIENDPRSGISGN
jgi:hypothetical protein